jgi:hypothetical protein
MNKIQNIVGNFLIIIEGVDSAKNSTLTKMMRKVSMHYKLITHIDEISRDY